MQNENKWKCLDGDCLFQDENGNVFYSSPEDNWFTTCAVLMTIGTLMPVIMMISFKLGGL